MISKILKFLSVILTISKYVFSILLMILAFTTKQDWLFLLVNILELMVIAITSNILVGWSKNFGRLYNIILLFFFNVQMAVLFFGGSYITLNMLSNLDSLQALSGNYFVYFTLIIFLVTFTFLPIDELKVFNFFDVAPSAVLSATLFVELGITLAGGNAYSPLYNIVDLGIQQYDFVQQQKKIAKQPNVTKEFYRPGINNSRKKPSNLVKTPNVIVIFTEGLSQNVVSDSRDFMPNVKALQKQSLNFTNYYNHTLATYRGIIGQLYSGYQLENTDTNTLVSIQDIFADYGYQTAFINTEPRNTQFTGYLDNLNFETLISDSKTNYSGASQTLSDKEAFEALWETINTQAESSTPFFTGIYTFGTHMSLDSTDELYKTGSDAMLNKFYNFDVQFGEFIEKFNNSRLSKDTIIVFTADHATYQDAAFTKTFSNYKRSHPHVDKMPFFIYHKGIKPENIDAQGRNSLDMAPTLLDYLDMSKANYFLGETLFMQKNNNNSYDTVFHDDSFILSTDAAKISLLSELNEETITLQLEKYFAAKTQVPQVPDSKSNRTSSSSTKSPSSTKKSSSDKDE